MKIPEILRRHKVESIIICLITIFIVCFSYFSVLRHQTFNSEYYDLAIMDQTVYNTSRGRILQQTNPDGANTISRLSIHNDIFLIFIAPFYWLHSGPETLVIIQTIIVAIGAWYVYKIGQLIFKSDWLGFVVAISYLLYPPLQWSAIFDFHAVTLATTFLLAMIYYQIIGRNKLSLLFLILSILTKEQVAAVTLFWGVYLIFKERRPRFGLVVFIISAIWAVTSVFFIIPYFRESAHFAVSRYQHLNNITAVIKQVTQFSTFRYLYLLLFPLGFLSLFSPIILVILPELAINLLSSNLNQRDIIHHYTAVLTPFLFIAAIYGLLFLKNKFHLPEKKVAILILIVTVLVSYKYSPLPYSQWAQFRPFQKSIIDESYINSWQEKLYNENIAVAASGILAPHFSDRKTIIRFSQNYKTADYVILYKPQVEDDWFDPNGSRRAYEMLTQDPEFRLIDKKGEVEVYKKISNF